MYLPFIGQLLLVMLIISGVSYQTTNSIINQLTRELGDQIIGRVSQEIDRQLLAPRQVNAINSRLLASDFIQPRNLSDLAPLLQVQLEQFPGLGYVHLASSDGSYVALLRNKETENLELSWHGPGDGIRPLPVFSINRSSDPIDLLRTDDFDARAMLWYQNALKNPYALDGFSSVYGQPSNPSGVVGADIWPIHLTRFLANLDVGPGTQIYIVDQRGFLVASSSSQKLYRLEGQRLIRQKALEADDQIIREIATLMESRFGLDLAQRQIIDSDPYMLVSSMWSDPSGLEWQIVVATPEDNYLAPAKQMLRLSFVLILISLIVSIVVSRLSARLVAKPLTNISNAAQDLARGNLDQRLGHSAVDEVNDLTLSFNSMAGQLQTSYGKLQALKDYQESILQSMPSGVVSFTTDGHVRSVNHSAEVILRQSSESLINSSIHDIFAGNNAWLSRTFVEVNSSGQPSQLFDVQLSFGDYCPSVNLSLQPLHDPKLGIIGTVLMLDDISEEKRIKGTMARYMDPLIADQLLRSGSDVLGGSESRATVLFSDIRGFTSLSEALGPQETVQFLNRYFTQMVDCLQEESGILDKFIGDAIMAVFGLPEPSDEDADHALSAALAMHQELATLNSEGILPRENLLSIGIGIHTDDIVSGNIGSPKRMNYTVIGDGVNLASRLESACKLYGASILVSDSTLSACHGQYLSREVDLVVVKGKLTPVLVHEVFVPSRLDCPSNWSDFLGHYSDSLALYRSRQWSDALESFQQCIALRPSDRLSSLYIERCHYYLSDPPGDDWNGVWTLTSK